MRTTRNGYLCISAVPDLNKSYTYDADVFRLHQQHMSDMDSDAAQTNGGRCGVRSRPSKNILELSARFQGRTWSGPNTRLDVHETSGCYEGEACLAGDSLVN